MKCPICKADVKEPAPDQSRGHLPFCSERCKLIDLGRWLGGKYQIPVEDDPDQPRQKRVDSAPPDND